jgi:hypothetical protein
MRMGEQCRVRLVRSTHLMNGCCHTSISSAIAS